jgi:glycosyltransferase involved in cell wall biosynthesis/putative flippase GtrA
MSTAETHRLAHAGRLRPAASPAPVIEIVVPVFNEERALEASILRLHGYLSATFPFAFHITIADNASTDRTAAIARRLAAEMARVSVLRLEEKGRGRALRAAWSRSRADVLCYMDVDLSTDLDALLPLVAPLVSGHSDLAIGTRLARGARITRGRKRELISRGYNLILHAALRSRFSDAQCGFKAIRADVARALLPAVVDGGWFFDTELLVLAERSGLRIHEVPVDWVEDPDSRVAIVRTALADLRGVGRMLRNGRGILRPPGQSRPAPERFERQVGSFAAIGAVSTFAYVVIYSGLRGGLAPLEANAVTLLVTAVANTAANRRLTFGRRGRTGAVRHHLGGIAVFAIGLGITSAALTALEAAVARPSRAEELICIVAANGLATVARFVLLRLWVFRPAAAPSSCAT